MNPDAEVAQLAGSTTNQIVSEALTSHVYGSQPGSHGGSEVVESITSPKVPSFVSPGSEVRAQVQLASEEARVAAELARQARQNSEDLRAAIGLLRQEMATVIEDSSAKEGAQRQSLAVAMNAKHEDRMRQHKSLQASMDSLMQRMQELESGVPAHHELTQANVDALGTRMQLLETKSSSPAKEAKRAEKEAIRTETQKATASLMSTVGSLSERMRELESRHDAAHAAWQHSELERRIGMAQDETAHALRRIEGLQGTLRKVENVDDLATLGARVQALEEKLRRGQFPTSPETEAPQPKAVFSVEELRRRVANTLQPKRLEKALRDREASLADVVRAPTSPVAFSAHHLSKSGAQSKATWSVADHETIAAIPNSNHTEPFVHSDLEDRLVGKVMELRPDHRAVLGYSDVVLRDMANCVVREIVGILDCLLDRLLIDKKRDVLMSMVSQLMTDDLAATVMKGQELLKKREFGHIHEEFARIRTEICDSEARWNDRFRVTDELRRSQDDLWTKLGEKIADLTSRVGRIEGGCYVLRSELEEHLRIIGSDIGHLTTQVKRLDNHNELQDSMLGDLRTFCAETYATKMELLESERTAARELASKHEELTGKHEELRNGKADLTEMRAIRQHHETRLTELDSKAFENSSEISATQAQMTKLQRLNDATFATKVEMQAQNLELTAAREALESRTKEELLHLRETKATEQALQEANVTAQNNYAELKKALGSQSSTLDRTSTDLKRLEEHCKLTLATREYAQDIAHALAWKVANECDEKELIAQLRREFEEERERLRQMVRQHQHSRQDLNETMEELHDLKLKSGELDELCGVLGGRVKGLDDRESIHMDDLRMHLMRHQQRQDELEAFHRGLREEFLSHVDMQRSENERLKDHSTLRYLEQMDKALVLTKAVDRVAAGHSELKDTVKNIKLPPVEATPR